MPAQGEERRRASYKRLAAVGDRFAWQQLGAPDRSPFFLAWSGASTSVAEDDRPSWFEPDRDWIRAADFRARMRATDPARARRLDVRAVLAEAKGYGAGDEQDDDTTLSVSRTALFDRTRRESDPGRYVETTEVPFLTLSIAGTFAETGVALGDLATVVIARTGRRVHAIVGDGRRVAGVEPSLWIADKLGLAAGEEAIYLIHPGSGAGQGTIPANADIHRLGDRLFRRPPADSRIAWDAILADCFADLRGNGRARRSV